MNPYQPYGTPMGYGQPMGFGQPMGAPMMGGPMMGGPMGKIIINLLTFIRRIQLQTAKLGWVLVVDL